MTCKWIEAWIGPCKNGAGANGLCAEHSGKVCANQQCQNEATHNCEMTFSLVCGAPLCDNCTDTGFGNHVTKAEYPTAREAKKAEQDEHIAAMKRARLLDELGIRESEVATALIVDLIERMEKADAALTLSAGIEPEDSQERFRLNAKATGVRLCLSYAREALRMP